MGIVPTIHRKDRKKEKFGGKKDTPGTRGVFRSFPFLLFFLFIFGMFLAIGGHSGPKPPRADYAGMQTCVSAGCHADYRNYTYHGAEQFLQTMHARTHSTASPESIIIDRWFRADTTLRYRDPRVKDSAGNSLLLRLHYDPSGTYQARLVTTGPGADSTGWMKIAYAFGGNGWLQRYLVEIGGSRYTLPFQYVLPGYRNRADTGQFRFIDVGEWIAYDADADRLLLRRPDDRTFTEASWDNACIGCHVGGFALGEETPEGSGIRKGTWPMSESGDSALRDMNLSIGCESCHGPGSLHAADAGNKEYQKALSPKLWDPSEGSHALTDRKLDLCNQCHNTHRSSEGIHPYAYSDAGDFPFIPGTDLRDFIRDPVADARYWGDGFTSAAHHQTGQDYARSKHYTNHIFPNGCYDCHDPHTNTDQPYMLNRNWYSLRKGEGCVSFGCHTAFSNTQSRNGKVYNIHTAHLQQHSQCVNCHYTKVASFGETGHNEFSDHSDLVLRPVATLERRDAAPAGMPNTCAISCHRNGYGDRNRPDAFLNVLEGEGMRAPDFGITDTNLMRWNEPSDIALADSLWEGFKRLYPQFVSSVRSGNGSVSEAALTSLSPNPAREEVKIKFTLPRKGEIRLAVYDGTGRLVRIIAEGGHEAGAYTDTWNCVDELHRIVPAGIYFVRLSGEGFSTVKRLGVVR